MGMEGRRDVGMVMRKGPWTAEEDEILMDYVTKYGPRDWSSIRSKGLLPRTGKSCRLRWVNKLKPDLKTGCKFSAEEERIVIELQARFGNKWARIATYLQGRTDNDVKNFWSTRQKRLARILQTPTTTMTATQRNHGKSPVCHEMLALEPPGENNFIPFQEGSSFNGGETSDPMKVVQLPDLEPGLPVLEPIDADVNPCFDDPMNFLPSFPQLAQPPEMEFPPLVENHDLIAGLDCDMSFSDLFGNQRGLESGDGQQFPFEVPFFGPEKEVQNCGTRRGGGDLGTPDSFFDDFPADMFEW
ncbi:Transcription factor GAMYB [Acorus calamus]|uniref:Transcription factor GAMYB n=1 Tax=Acorus calamus TaxID=4465 RepID=A0AAV9DXU4_ACOCL|nr:Transcription factor GAMYB [Acorus calamus]